MSKIEDRAFNVCGLFKTAPEIELRKIHDRRNDAPQPWLFAVKEIDTVRDADCKSFF